MSERPETLMRMVLLIAGLAVVGLSAEPHHSPSLFDQERDLQLEGVITRVEWTNPHVYIHIEVETEPGRLVEWMIEAQSPRVMSLFGWFPASLMRGDHVVVAAHPRRDSKTRMALGRSVVRRNSTTLRIPWQQQEIRDALRRSTRQ